MKDYIKDGLEKRIAPSGILKNIEKALAAEGLSAAEKAELEAQKEKIKKYVDVLGW